MAVSRATGYFTQRGKMASPLSKDKETQVHDPEKLKMESDDGRSQFSVIIGNFPAIRQTILSE